MEDPTDEELAEDARGGSQDAFRELVSRHKNLVFGMLFRQIGRREVAEDLSQEVFLRAYRGLQSFRGDASFKTWLAQITLNAARSHFRSKAFSQSKQTSSSEEVLHADPVTYDEDPIQREEVRDAFRHCFAKLKDGMREVVSLCGFEERSYEETAELLGLPIGTVRSRLNRARLAVRECLERKGVTL